MKFVSLRDLCIFKNGGTPSKANADYWHGDIPWVSPKDMKQATIEDASDHISERAVQNSATSIVPEGSMLVVIRSGILVHSFPVAKVARPVAFNQDIKAVIPASTSAHPDYLYWFLRSSERKVLTQGVKKGATVHSVQSGFIEDLKVPLRTIDEQRRTVDLLSRADGIARLRREASTKAAELIPAIFHDMFGDPAKNPRRWPSAMLGEFFQVKGGKRLPKGVPYSDSPTEFRYIRGTDIQPDLIEQSALVFLTRETQATIARYVVATGDVVITIAGKIGVAAPVDETLDGVNLTENAAIIRSSGEPRTRAAYLSSILNSDFVQRQIESLTGRVTIGKLALERIKLIEVRLPPLELQQEYERRVTQVRSILAQQQAATENSATTVAALLFKVFDSELL